MNEQPTKISAVINCQTDIMFAQKSDIPAWMDLVRLVVDGFPYLNEAEYLEQLEEYISQKQTVLIKDNDIIIGAMAFNKKTGSIDFLGIHPQYKKQELLAAFLQKLLCELLKDTLITTTTFRAEDKADPGYREIFEKLGFAEAELLIEFGYPTQKFILRKENFNDVSGE
ncbi:MAG: GNAT family N-acetyltransferase [Oscillospiraceae bacterium]